MENGCKGIKVRLPVWQFLVVAHRNYKNKPKEGSPLQTSDNL